MGQLKWPGTAQPTNESSSTQVHPLGARGEDIFGREWCYAQAGAADLVVGDALQGAIQVANHQATTATAQAIGDKEITITPGATAGAANLYEGGIAIIDTTPGVGYSYPIAGHLAITSSVAFALKLAVGWPVEVALTTTSRITLVANLFKNVIQAPTTTATGASAGVCQHIIAATQYGWIGKRGLFGTLIQGTPAAGMPVTSQASVAGAVAVHSANLPLVGVMAETGNDGKVNGVVWGL